MTALPFVKRTWNGGRDDSISQLGKKYKGATERQLFKFE